MADVYRTVLAAIDCSDESRALLQRAVAVTADVSHLHLVHVIEPLALAYGADVPMDVSEVQNSLMDNARSAALDYAGEFGVPADNVHVELGSIEKTIQDKAERIHADLIVVGSHTRTGLALLLGSTARGLVPGARCDVLAVKVGDQPR